MREHLLRFDKTRSYVFIDCETFNLCLNKSYNLPWQIAMIKVIAGEKVAEKNFYIKWETDLKIGEKAAEITRYSQKTMERLGVTPKEVFPTIQDWLDKADWIIAHNMLNFDLYLIKDYYRLFGFGYKHLIDKILDTNALAKGVKLNAPYRPEEGSLIEYQYRMAHIRQKGLKTNLTALGKGYGIEHDYENLHDALIDLDLNLKVWNKMKWQLEI